MTPDELKRWFEISKAEVFDMFESEFSGKYFKDGEGDETFLYIPGRRPDRVVLIAHADTVWDHRPEYPSPVRYADGRFVSNNEFIGIGADDRAGCATLWRLRKSGHSLLITDGEEKAQRASYNILTNYPDLLKEINGHQFMVQFDRQGSDEFKCYDVGSDEFRQYISSQLGYFERDFKGQTDICALCTQIAGANISIGYYNEHLPNEYLIYDEWVSTSLRVENWITNEELPKFRLRLPHERPADQKEISFSGLYMEKDPLNEN